MSIGRQDPAKRKLSSLPNVVCKSAYIYQRIPAFPEVAVGDQADRLTQLRLDCRWYGDHKSNKLALDRNHLILLKLIVPLFIGPISLDKVLEEQGTRQASVEREGIGRCDLKEQQREARLLLLRTNLELG